jgi:hypothetical protein
MEDGYPLICNVQMPTLLVINSKTHLANAL